MRQGIVCKPAFGLGAIAACRRPTFTVNRDGSGYFTFQSLSSLSTAFWFGNYAAVA